MPVRPPLGDQHLPELSRHAEPSPREQPLLLLASRSSAPEHFCLARRAGRLRWRRRTNALDDNQASVLGLAALLLVGESERSAVSAQASAAVAKRALPEARSRIKAVGRRG
jgi:hypothetical protein